MTKTVLIESVSDMLDLSPDEFQRMLPDLWLWYVAMRPLQGVPGVKNKGFTWTDDGRIAITAVQLIDPKTGAVTEVPL